MMDFDKNIKAELVWCGTDFVGLPSGFENPCDDQMQGTPHERLSEIAARICYDSCGIDSVTKKRKGRTTDQMHEHLLEVKNYNVYEHADFTVLINGLSRETILHCMINRPGVWCELTSKGVEVTMNHRCVLEWDEWVTSFGRVYDYTLPKLGAQLWNHARTLAPRLYPNEKDPIVKVAEIIPKSDALSINQSSVSLYLSFSRACGNEQVRHRFRMSQRSTRFVNESDSSYIQHPLITRFLDDPEVPDKLKADAIFLMKQSENQDKITYNNLVGYLQNYLKKQGVEGTQAIKQARGASRGYLGLALHTEMVFTATVKQCLWMLSQRGTALADAEIRVLYSSQVLRCLQKSRYGHFFEDFKVAPSPDGIGDIVVRS